MSESHNEFAAVRIGDSQLVPWYRVAAVASMVSFSLPTFVTGLELSHGLAPVDTLWSVLIGSLIIFLIGGVMGVIGSRTRMSSYLLVRVAFGDTGAGVVNIAFAISLLGWFGININLFTDAVGRLLLDLFGYSVHPWALVAFASVCMTTTTLIGFKAINLLATLMVPVLAVVTVLFFTSSLEIQSLGQIMSMEKATGLTIGEGASAVVGAIIIGAIILPDITRFIKHWKGALYTAFLAYMVVEVIVMFAAGMAGATSGKSDILEIMLDMGLGLGAFAVVIAGSWVLNSLNLYSAALSTEATFTKLNSTAVILVLGAIGIAAALMNFLDSFVTFLFYLSIIFVPVAGVILSDYLFIRPEVYKIETLDQRTSMNVRGFIAWLLGAALTLLGAEGFVPAISGIAAIDAIILSGGVYTLLSWGHRAQPNESTV
ncbi:MAG: cytosine permease [Arenicella sp.]|nr:cytosine permease [Arenicella sp.]